MLIILFGVTRCVEITHCGLKEKGEQEVDKILAIEAIDL